jgi:hypothetical protein
MRSCRRAMVEGSHPSMCTVWRLPSQYGFCFRAVSSSRRSISFSVWTSSSEGPCFCSRATSASAACVSFGALSGELPKEIVVVP